MTAYRKRGTEVDAFHLTTPDDAEFPEWLRALVALDRVRIRAALSEFGDYSGWQYLLDPPSGKGTPLVANVGDWVVRNARGDVFPMTAEKFAETYETTEKKQRVPRLALLRAWQRLRLLRPYAPAEQIGRVDVDTAIIEAVLKTDAGDGDIVHCSFCGKSPREVRHLVAAAGARICDECFAGARELEPKKSEWIACADRLPEMSYHAGDTVGVVRSGEVLAYALGEVKFLALVRINSGGATWEGDGPDELGASFALGDATHWMPLPEPPK